MYSLDRIDRKIIHELDINSRQSYKSIAKKIRLSKDAAKYRIEKLESNGIIKQYQTILDTGKLGYMSFRLLLKFKNTDIAKEKEIIEYLKSNEKINWLVSVEGEWDLNTWILCKRVDEINKIIKELIMRYGNFIEKRQISIFTKITYFEKGFIIQGKRKKEFVFVTSPDESRIDKTDIRILMLLTKNARMKTVDIAKRMNASAKMIAYRIKNLEKGGIIIGYRVLLDTGKLGLGQLYYKINIRSRDLTSKRENDFRLFIRNHPNVIYDNEVLGGDDFEIEIQVNCVNDFRDFILQLRNLFSDIIRNHSVLIYSDEHKFNFMPVMTSKKKL